LHHEHQFDRLWVFPTRSFGSQPLVERAREEEAVVDDTERPAPSPRVAALLDSSHGDLCAAAEQMAALASAAHAELLDLVAAVDRKGSWRDDGATSAAAWVVEILHVSWGTAKEWVRVARALEALPCVRAAFAEGVLSWDQVRHATVFLEPADDEEAARHLPGLTAGQIEERARFHRARDRRDANDAKRFRSITWRQDTETGGFRYRGFLPAEQGAIVNAALEQRAERMGKNAETDLWDPIEHRQADALVDLAREDLAEHPGPDPTVVVVHVDADVVDGTTDGNGSIDGIPVPVDTVRRLLCDCSIEYSVDGPDGTCIGIGRAGREPPRWLRRRCLRRDGTCRFPGCGRRIRHVHHIRHWTKGGVTDSWNLAGLCWDHHHLVHEGGWTIEGRADGELTFTSPFGVRRTSRPRPLDPKVRRRIQDATGAELHADDDVPPTGTDPPRP
jgi:hypothetical protein